MSQTRRTGTQDDVPYRVVLWVMVTIILCSFTSGEAEETSPRLGAAPQSDVHATPAQYFDIPAQDLGAALTAFADTAGVRLLFASEIVAGKRSTRVTGTYTTQQALALPLHDTGFSFRFTDTKTVTLEQTLSQSGEQRLWVETTTVEGHSLKPGARPSFKIGETQVTAERDAPAYSTGYLPEQSSTGSNKLDLPIREQANVIQIVPRTIIEDRGAVSVHNALETVVGVRPVSPAYSSGSAGIRSRGFEADANFVNGTRLGAFGHPLDTANIGSSRSTCKNRT